MEVGRQKYLRDDQTSNCWSYGSINHPASQSRKMSIGVVVDSIAKKKSGLAKEREVVVPNAETVHANLGNTIQGKINVERVTAAKKTEEAKNPEQLSSPWLSTRPFFQEIPTSDAALHAKQASNLSSGSKRQCKLDNARNTPLTYSVEFFANQTSILNSGDNKQKKFSGVTYKKSGLNDGVEEVQDFTFATVQEVLLPDKEVLVDKTHVKENTRTETLRMKLWNILGATASPNDQHPKSQEHEVGDVNLNPQPEFDQMGDMVKPKKNSVKPEEKYNGKGDIFIKPRQCSDTIETDSESPENSVRRPVTRSLIQKRARAKGGQRTAKPGPSSGHKQKQQDNVFSFEQECFENAPDSAGGRSLKPIQKKRENTGFRTESHEVCLPEKDNSTKIQQAISSTGKRPPAKKACSLHNKRGDFHRSLPDNEREFLELEKNIQEKEIYQSPLISKTYGRDFDNPESKDQREDEENPSLKNADPEDNFLSPTFGIRPPMSSSSPSSIAKSDQMADCSSPASTERRFNLGDIRRFRTSSTSKQEFSDNAQTQSSDAAEEIKDSPLRKTTPEMEKNDSESGLSLSSTEERDLRSFQEGSPIIQGHKWAEEDNCIEEPSELNEMDGLARAVELFALGLEKLKTKMKTATTRKSSEILKSVAAEVHLQLQTVESQIQTDMGKLMNLNKSKRKKMETRFEEQQEQLKVICDKFKEQVNQHLQDCRSTFEGLEVYQTEFKGAVEKQKASHRKLVSQVEEAIETQLNEAQKRIKVMNETTRGQMVQLKHQLALCLKEGILS